jgi:GNAT superfamily N-acetyltransferase
MEIVRYAPESLLSSLPQFVTLLQDAVNGGASVGFLPPLNSNAAEAYWRGVAADGAILLAAIEAGEIVGTVQLALAEKANARHRAEVQKLMVLTEFRGRGVASGLMERVEEIAIAEGRTLLVLDTQQGSVAESLYRKLGYIEAGAIPDFARSADGYLCATVILYKSLKHEE